MTIEFNDKGKIFTDVVLKIPSPAVVQTTNHIIYGMIHVRRGERLKDELDREELFLAITQAKVLGDNGQVLYQSDFLAVRRNQIVWVMPGKEKND